MKNKKIAVIGLGYVGLPLAIEFGKKRETIGFDINLKRINDLQKEIDITNEISSDEFKAAKNLSYTNNINDLTKCEIFIITVPTPIDKYMQSDLTFVIKSSELVGSIISKGNIVIYESTVYPGVTEEICAPIIEKKSGLVFNRDFYCGYSPERINPGDKFHRITSIKKVTAGSTPTIAIEINKLYQEIIAAGTHLAPSIKIAEASKVIENTQRDLNIALINEFAIIFNRLNINTQSVLEASETKWNFLPFKPGLVGGHCIGVDPYYLAYKSIQAGYNPEMILSGRRLNNSMPSHIVDQVFRLMKKKFDTKIDLNVLIMGFTFKENCPDIRNTQVLNLVEGFQKLNFNVDVFDPYCNDQLLDKNYKFKFIKKPIKSKYHAIVLAVAHDQFKKLSLDQIREFGKEQAIIYDIKYLFNANETDGSL